MQQWELGKNHIAYEIITQAVLLHENSKEVVNWINKDPNEANLVSLTIKLEKMLNDSSALYSFLSKKTGTSTVERDEKQ